MKNSSFLKFTKYVLSFAVSLAILWYLFKDEDLDNYLTQAKSANFYWIYLSIFLAMISHWIRAYRWKLFITPLGYRVTTPRLFLAVMIGYVSNLLLPRVGEVVKCGVLNKLEGVPVSKSIGTIITERILDLIILLLLLAATLVIEFDRLKDYLVEVFGTRITLITSGTFWQVFLISCFLIGTIASLIIYKNLKKLKKHPYFGKAFHLLKDLGEGLTSVTKIKNKWGFWTSTMAIWLLYFVMSYIVVFSLPATSGLSLTAGLTILTMGSIGMAAPVQGGIGTYHFMISNVLMLYGIQYSDGKLFAALLHTSQTIGVVIVGVFCIFIAGIIKKNVSQKLGSAATVTVNPD